METELSEDGPFTVLGLSDHALKTLPEAELKEIMESKALQEEIIRRHVLRGNEMKNVFIKQILIKSTSFRTCLLQRNLLKQFPC